MAKNIYLDGMMGLVVGDALGVPVQFYKRNELKQRAQGPVTEMEAGGVYNMPKGTWSDDSSMALATLDSLYEKDGIDLEDIMDRFVSWLINSKYTPEHITFDQGNTCVHAIMEYMRNKDVKTCARTDVKANGNGALMRILPVCLYYYERQKRICTSEDEAIQTIHNVGALTHNHIRSHMCLGLYYFMVKHVINDKNSGKKLITILQEAIDEGVKYYRQDLRNFTVLSYLGRLFDLREFEKRQEEEIRSSGYVIDSIEAAVWCLLKTASYRDAMILAVNLGDDTDTVAAIAGGLAGLFYGYESIPDEWLSEIKRRQWIEKMCLRAQNE